MAQKPKRKMIGYGVKPPYFSLGDALAITKRVHEEAGGDVSEDELSSMLGNSVGSSSFRLKVQSLKNFKLLTQDRAGQRLILSPIAKSIFGATSHEERSAATKEAFLSLDPYRKLYSAYAGKLLPSGEYLLNAIREQCGVPSELTNQWKESFMSSGAAAGLFQERSDGKIQVRLAPTEPLGQPPEEALMPALDEQTLDPERPSREQQSKVGDFESFSFPLLDGRKGVVQFSRGWTLSDVKKMLELMRVAFLWNEAEAKKPETH